MIQMRKDSEPDPRILVVAVTEEDIQKLKQWPLSGEILDKLFTKLESYQPRAIGLDIFRDLRVEPGHDKLLKHLQQSDRIVSVCKHSDSINPATPPPGETEPYQVGFSDIVTDADNIIRRNLLYLNPGASSPCKTPYSLSLQLALRYLGNIQPKLTPEGDLQIGNTEFKRLQNNSGAYQNADTNGYQILLNYRSAKNAAKQVSLSDVLSDKIDASLVKNRVVIIGATAPSLRDFFNTPYSSGMKDNREMPGVFIHAQSVSQILSAVVDKKPLFWFWSQWGEVAWIWVWTLTGGLIAWRILHPLYLGVAGGVSLGALFGSNFVIFNQAGWIPVVSPALGWVLAVGSVITYNAYQVRQQQAKIARRVQEQEEAIALLQTLLKEGTKQDENKQTNDLSEEITVLDTSQSGSLLDSRYRIIKSVGSGGFGKTYLVEDTKRPGNPQCVLKHLQPARQDSQFLDVARRLFKTEAEILELLGKHNQIPQLLAVFEENQQFYLVQEFIDGHDFNDELPLGQRLSETQVIEVLKDVLKVLSFVHSHGVIHRDIKPSNLIRRKRDRRLVLIDFGAVKQIQNKHREEENQTIAIGTAGYAPPEQLMGQPRLNSDIYALGMIGIQALTGIAPRKLERDKTTNTLIWQSQVQTSKEFAVILDKMVAFDANKRYQSVEEVLQNLERL
jgi:CHASE2 domain-containing sensor protein/tRNA A-37 threonylcarbamoyl transferase component Bud32